MSDSGIHNFISSKEILEVTNISRATLNNYIRLGIIPKPVVRKPVNGQSNIKNLGYFPSSTLNIIEDVKKLKKEGKPMAEIARILGSKSTGHINDGEYTEIKKEEKEGISNTKKLGIKSSEQELNLTLEGIKSPAYFINYDFEIIWINNYAEEKILNQKISNREKPGSRNIFKLFFNWEFHSRVHNWRDLISFHMSFAKLKFSKTWLGRMYKGITFKEINILEEIYDEINTSSDQTIQDTFVNLLMKEGFTNKYHVYTAFFSQGILFLYILTQNFNS